MIKKIEKAVNEVYEEYQKASSKYGPFNSPHEGYAVIKEELDELWDEIKKWKGTMDETELIKIRKEAMQIGAMALRFMIDICETDE